MNKKNIIIISSLSLLFVIIAVLISTNKNLLLDTAVYNFISKNIITNKLTRIVKLITNLGSATFLITTTLVLIVLIKNKKCGLLITINLALSKVLNIILKNIFKRPRPQVQHLVVENGYSFPSAHAMVSMAFYGFLIYLIIKNIKNKKLKYILVILLSIVILLIGISRIYLGVHYTTDVLAGYIISIIYLMIYTKAINKVINL